MIPTFGAPYARLWGSKRCTLHRPDRQVEADRAQEDRRIGPERHEKCISGERTFVRMHGPYPVAMAFDGAHRGVEREADAHGAAAFGKARVKTKASPALSSGERSRHRSDA